MAKRIYKRRKRRSIKPRFWFFCAFAAVLIVSVVVLVSTGRESKKQEQAFSSLAQQAEENTVIVSVPPAYAPTPETTPKPITYTEYLSLYEENNDFVGWLHIDNTKIDYPVMHTPDDTEYYLRRAFDKSSSQSGTPFIGAGGDIDSDLFIIYGHNMQNDTMFGSLEWYKDKAFWQENPIARFTTTTEEREYEIFAALKTRVLYQDETGYRWYYKAGALSQSDFDELIAYLTDNSLYDTGIIPTYGEQIVILSTCAYHTDNGRFIVAARRISDKEN